MTRIVCVSADFFPMEKLYLDRGRMFNSEDDRTMRLAAIIGVNIADKLFGTPGSANYVDPIGKRIKIGAFGEVEVIGLLKRENASLLASFDSYDSTNNGTVFIPFSTSNRMGGSVQTYDLRVEAVSVEKVEAANQGILSVLSVNHGNWDGKPKFDIQTGKSAISEVDKMTAIVTTFIAAVAGISLIVAGIGVMNVMLISVKERTREIGTRKALGARGAWIGRQFLIESLVVCLSGGTAGVLLATLVAVVITHFTFLPAVVPSNTIPLSLILSTSVAFAFGWLPARRASKMDPCEALRYE
jgi:putative ABC transport system permease protein